ncbi:hypothetical protein BGX34_002577 [Mortierella sp. NVP85]|nr:hypothetical protein BGX34_002577 [Mortierella sp. NVP85]
MDLNVSVQPDVTLLRDLDVDHDPVLVLVCGHAVAMSILDRESAKATNPNGKHSARCPWCQRWTTYLMRYRHQLVHLPLEPRKKGDWASLSEMMVKARKRLGTLVHELEEKKVRFMHSLLGTEVPPCNVSPNVKERRLGKHDKRSFPFPQSDVKTLSRIYGIPTTDEIAWKVLVEPLTLSIQQFTTINWKASEAVAKKASAKDPRVSTVEASNILQNTLPPSKVISVKEGTPEVSGTEVLPTPAESRKDFEAAAGSGFDFTAKDLVGFNSKETEVVPAKEESPEESILIESMQERIHILFIILSLAFAALDIAGSWSGWYWFIEDLINCIDMHITLARNIASRVNSKRRVIEARLIHLDLLSKKMLWTGLQPLPTDRDANTSRDLTLLKLQKQAESEQTEVRNGCTEMEMEGYLTLAYKLRVKMTRAIKVADRDTLTFPMLWGDESTPLYQPNTPVDTSVISPQETSARLAVQLLFMFDED